MQYLYMENSNTRDLHDIAYPYGTITTPNHHIVHISRVRTEQGTFQCVIDASHLLA